MQTNTGNHKDTTTEEVEVQTLYVTFFLLGPLSGNTVINPRLQGSTRKYQKI